MRAMFTFTASFLICGSLMGCNRHPQAETPAPVAAAAPVCNCAQRTAAATPAAVTTRRHRHHRHSWDEHESSSYSDSYSQQSENAYSPSESGSSEYRGGDESEQSSSVAAHAEAAAWIDGYGRSHYTTEAQESDGGDVAELTAKDIHRRLEPYHAYNSDCDRR